MSIEHVYRTNAQAVLLAARDLEEALDAGDAEDVPSLAGTLLSAALAREAGGTVAGFQARDTAPAETAPKAATVEEQLSLALTELEIGGVLLTGSVVAGPLGPETGTPTGDAALGGDVAGAFSDAVDHLDDSSARLVHVGAPAVSELFGGRQPDPEEFFTQLPRTVDGIVARTVGISQAAVTGLTKIPAAQLQPVFTSALSVVPDLSALAKAGMRAIARALDAISGLVPEKLREQVREWAKEWWEQHAEGIFNSIVRKALSVAELETAMKTAIEAARQRANLPKAPLQQGATRLQEIGEQHSRVTKVIERIIGALSRLIGPLVILVPAGAPWIYLSGGGGLLTALGAAVWVGRDYLDTGVPFEHVPGVRTVLMTATA